MPETKEQHLLSLRLIAGPWGAWSYLERREPNFAIRDGRFLNVGFRPAIRGGRKGRR